MKEEKENTVERETRDLEDRENRERKTYTPTHIPTYIHIYIPTDYTVHTCIDIHTYILPYISTHITYMYTYSGSNPISTYNGISAHTVKSSSQVLLITEFEFWGVLCKLNLISKYSKKVMEFLTCCKKAFEIDGL